MKPVQFVKTQVVGWGKQIILFLGFTAAVIVLLLWLAGKFDKKVSADLNPAQTDSRYEGQTVQVRRITLPLTESAVGTIRAIHETNIGSKLLARVVEVHIKQAGQKVQTGEVLFRLDDSDIKAKLEQAKATLESMTARAAQAESDAKRAADLLPNRAISRQEYENLMALHKTANADVERTQELLKEAQATLDWATVRAPFDGQIVDKKVDVGDMVAPGQILATLYDPDRMQLVASVRDSLAGLLQVGQDIGVQVEGIDKRCNGYVSEIVPESQSASRSFQVKVTGPCPPGIHAGRFGRIYIPLREEQILVIPQAALRHVGQLELVEVVEKGKVSTRAIRTGRTHQDNPLLGNHVEVLSGLQEGEKVVVKEDPKSMQEASHG
jgi:RND family efflux transporter MFP subunit